MPIPFHILKEQYPKGYRLHLPVKKIITEHGLIIFDIEGYAGRLHISEIANDRTLSEKLFSIIKVNELINVVIIGFNNKKEIVNLSLKPLRNNLTGAISPKKCEQIIQEEANDRINVKEKRLQQDRNTLDRTIGDLEKTDLTFLYELIQNAVDNPNSTEYENKVMVAFEIHKNYLLFKHNGAVMSESNFSAITGIFNSDDEKAKEKSKIGYKGIGFKSVFTYSQNVYIRSGNFNFSFNKEISGADKPWEVIPILEDEIVKIDTIQQFDFFNQSVAFTLELIDDTKINNVTKYLIQLSENPYLLIFLDRLIELKIVLPTNKYCITKEVQMENGNDVIKISNNNDKVNLWTSFSKKYEITDEGTINELLDDNIKAIPSKMRTFRTPTIQILLPADDSTTDLINLFTYLPLSNTNYGLPFIINADFIPNLDRTDIIQNIEYNYHIAEFAADTLIHFSKSLAAQKDYKRFLQTIPQFEPRQNKFLERLKTTYFKLCAEIPIFPTKKDNELCLFSNLLIDETGIFTLLQSEITALTGIDKQLISDEIDEASIIQIKALIKEHKQGIIYSIEDLKADLQKQPFKDWLKIPTNNFKIIQAFAANPTLQSLLESEAIVLAESGNLLKAGALYHSVPKEIMFVGVEKISSEVLKLLDENSISIPIKTFEAVAFYKAYILKYSVQINGKLGSEDGLLNFWRFIYDNWGLFDTEIKNSLRLFNVLCKKDNDTQTFSWLISNVYLSAQFNPENEIESILRDLDLSQPVYYIAEHYIDEQRTIDTWQVIFKTAGATTDLQKLIAKVIETLPTINEPTKHFNIAKQIFKYWNRNRTLITEDQTRTIKAQLKIKCENNQYLPIIECIISDAYYTDSTPIAEVLPSIVLDNLISKDYISNTTQKTTWKEFFRIFGSLVVTEKQAVLEKKLSFFCREQVKLQASHFDILKEISILYAKKSENNLSFSAFSGLALKTNKGTWVLASNIHFSSVYEQLTLDLEQNEDVNQNILFLNEMYQPKEISKSLLKKLGVVEDFVLTTPMVLHIDKIDDKNFVRYLENAEAYRKRVQEIRQIKNFNNTRRYPDEKIRSVTSVYTPLILNYANLLHNPLCVEKFIEYIIRERKVDVLSSVTELKIWADNIYKYPVHYNCHNYIIFLIQQNNTIISQKGEYKKPTELYSFQLQDYIFDKSELPQKDYSIHKTSDETISLEQLLGVQQELSKEHCINLLSKKEVILTKEEVEKLSIMKILGKYKQVVDSEYSDIKFPNQRYEWTSINALYCVEDKNAIDETKQLHSDFKGLAPIFGIKILSKGTLILKTEPTEPEITSEIIDIFKERAKFIAFKIKADNWDNEETKMIEMIKSIDFYNVQSLQEVWESIDLDYEERDFIQKDNCIYYTNDWTKNENLLEFLYSKLSNEGNLPQKWFEDVIAHWDISKIAKNLHDDFGKKVPKEWLDIIQEESDEEVSETKNKKENFPVTKSEKDALEKIKKSGQTIEQLLDFWENNNKKKYNSESDVPNSRTTQMAAESEAEYKNTQQNKGAEFNSGKEGEQIIYDDLCKKFPNRVKWTSSYSKDKQDDGTDEYDFEVYKDEKHTEILYYIDAKSTTLDDSAEKQSIELRRSEWRFITKTDNLSYLIARVFNVQKENEIEIVYLKVSKITF